MEEEKDAPRMIESGGRKASMEKQTVIITIQTEGETCEMTDAQIKEWYLSNVAKLFDPAYGTPHIEVALKREECPRQ